MAKKLPVVAIVGRRNVGKSTLFNALLKKKIAIVDDHPGLTRDIIAFRTEFDGKSFLLIDTPGLDLPSSEELSEKILEKAHEALITSDVITILLENPAPDSFDFELLSITRKTGKPIVAAVNKMDSEKDYDNLSNFYELGIEDVIPVSAKNRSNLDLLLNAIAGEISTGSAKEFTIDLKVAFVGKPNAGKSTLLNSYLGFDRAVVSEIPGTTRDAVNEHFNFHGKTIEVIDTAGLRKRSKVKNSVEFFSLTRTIRSIEDCDVVIHLIDAAQGITDTDKKIADEIMKANKPLIIAVNKWDTIDKETNTFNEFIKNLKIDFYRTSDFPILSISAKEKLRIHKLMERALELFENSKKHIETGKLNREIERMVRSGRLPKLGNELKVFYAAQLKTSPPTFKLFVNDSSKFRTDAVRYFQKELQKLLGVKGLPVKIILEGRAKKTNTKVKGKRR
jgi:GTP-binding protein